MAAGSLLAGDTVIGVQVGAATIRRFQPTTLEPIFGVRCFSAPLKFIAACFGVSIW